MSNTKITNVAAGAVSSTSTEAVNGSQLWTTNQNVAALNASVGLIKQDATSNAITIATATAGTTVDFTGTAGARQLKGVAAGVANTDAVNIGQLKTAGLTTDASGNVTNAFIAYNDATKGKVTLGGGNAGTTMTNVAAGALSDSSSDAVNGSQLYTTNQNVVQNSNDIAKNTSDIAQNTSDIAKNAGDITNIDSRVTNVEGSVSNITNQINNGELGLVQQDVTSGNITVAKDAAGAVVDFTGTAGARKLTGLSVGELSATSTDAVNGSQLYTTNQNVTQNTSDIAKNTSDIAQNTSDISKSAGDIAQNASDIAQNTSDIAKNAGDITNIDSRVTNVEGSVSNITNQINNGELGLVQQDVTSGNITVAKDAAGTVVDFTGTAGARKLTGLSVGELSATSTDAVNGSQLYATNQNVAQNSSDIVKNTGDIAQNASDIAQNTSDISKNTGDIAQNASDIAQNTSDITKNTGCYVPA
nr:hypothetical protein [Paraburkholderia aspalathi]